jgi:hypothetical protein
MKLVHLEKNNKTKQVERRHHQERTRQPHRPLPPVLDPQTMTAAGHQPPLMP